MKTRPIFENFKLLKSDMENNGWILDAFTFKYKNTSYIILAKLYQSKERKPKYALLKTEILEVGNTENNLIIPINSNGFMTDAKTLRQFFKIEYEKNLGNILQQFNENFSKFIPIQVSSNKTEILKKTMISSLSKSDSENPDKVYCFGVRRNSNKKHRTLFNDNKTKLLRPNLHTRFKEEPSISFCYSEDKSDEKTDEEILLNFSKRTY